MPTFACSDRVLSNAHRVAHPSILVACPDARPPAYQAVAGFAETGQLDQFVTGYYYQDQGRTATIARRVAPKRFARLERTLHKRHDKRIPNTLVESDWRFDAALAVENRLARRGHTAQHAVAQWRTRAFDRRVATTIERRHSDLAMIFSDVGSEFALPTCRRLGIPTLLSMVHGDVREEKLVLEKEAERSPDFFPIYLGDGKLDLPALQWLHDRRLRDLEYADRILVPSEHIASTLAGFGTPREQISVIPYAADTQRFQPLEAKHHRESCTFLFAGGITQRKGIKYLLEAWRMVRRPGWRLQLLGALPSNPGPLSTYLSEVELRGRVPHSEVPALMAQADIFAFPSLFEGSAVVTYEALACGLPCLVTPDAGSVVREGVEGYLVPPADVESLAEAMERLGSDPELRASMSAAARTRAEAHDWTRYRSSLTQAMADTVVFAR